MCILNKFVSMRRSVFHLLSLFIVTALLSSSCMILDGGNAYRKKNKCCGIIKCDMHRRSQVKKHKRTVHAHKSLKKREQRIKRGY